MSSESWFARAISAFRRNIRYAFRMFRQNPGFTAIAVLSLALGIGANTAIFTLLDSVMLRALPVRSPQELVVLARNPVKEQTGFNYPDYVFIRDHNQVFQDALAYSGGGRPTGLFVPSEGKAARTELIGNQFVTGNYFEMLGVTPALGRLFNAEDNRTPGAHPVAVLSYTFWQRRFGGSPDVIGKSIRLNGAVFTIVGVSRRGFHGLAVGSEPSTFTPIMMLQQMDTNARQWNTRHYWWLNVMARLKPGVGMPKAAAALDVLYAQILKNDPEHRAPRPFDKDWMMEQRGVVLPGGGGYSYLQREIAKPLQLLMAVVALVLLIACVNVANLLLARAAARRREIAIRLAIGAGRWDLFTQLLTEGLLLSIAGAVAGLAFAWWGVDVLLNFMPDRGILPMALGMTLDWRLIGFLTGLSLLAGLLFSFAPAFEGSQLEVASAIKIDSQALGTRGFGFRRLDLRRVLVVAQVGLSLLLLIGAGLFAGTLARLRDLDPGFDRESVLVVNLDPQEIGYKGQRFRVFFDRLRERVAKLPGVRMASLASITPLGGSMWTQSISVQGYTRKPDESPSIEVNAVSDGYFATMGIPILLGRDFLERDSPAVVPDPEPEGSKAGAHPPDNGPPRVAIVNASMAKRYFGNENPLGRRFSTTEDKYKAEESFEIVGVVKDTQYNGLREKAETMFYLPVWRGGPFMSVCVRSGGDPKRLGEAIRREAQALDSAVPVKAITTMTDAYDRNIVRERLFATLCGFFGILALALASIGLYGVMAQAVTRRTREIGIRMALGAQRRGVLRMILREASLLILAGAAIGIPVALALTRFVSSFLYGLQPNDPGIIAAATAVLGAITLLAAYLPAYRASRVDPMVALRSE